ncbi:MAG: hypothetical protein V1799_20650 [bacterium]
MKRILIILQCLLLVLSIELNAQLKLEQKSKKTFSHKMGALWNMITNNGYWGNTYSEPNFEWPGGSGNVYGWRASIWIGSLIDSVGYTSFGEGNHFVPLDTIQVKHRDQGSLSAEDTYARYTDVNPPSPTGTHKNLGVLVTERTYVWDQSYNDDFIISDYWIRNIGDDTNKDGLIDVTRTLKGVYVGFRMDADVSGFLGSSTDSDYWDLDDLANYDETNKLVYLFDADNPDVPGNDKGNPDPVTGILRSPGYIGIRVIDYDRAHFKGTYTGKPTMATPSYRYFEPTTSQEMYQFMRLGKALPDTAVRDYRAICAVGPFEIPPGDSIHIVVAWTIGYGLGGLQQNSQIAQAMYDGNYQKTPTAPVEPDYAIRSLDVSGQSSIALEWEKNAESSKDPITGMKDFAGYGVYRTIRSDAGGNPLWDTLAVYVSGNKLDPKLDSDWIGRPYVKSWPPATVVSGSDTLYQYIDKGVTNGMIYTYAVTAFDKGDSLLGLGRLENQIGKGRTSTRVYMANTPAAAGVEKVRVVPNPFIGSSRFNNPNPIETNPWVNRLRFINLPAGAKISIFTLAGDLVKIINSGDVVYRSRDVQITGDFRGVAEWDLTTKNNQEVVSGLYLYVVESPAGTQTGKFVIMR